jgi:hypothetical protein
MVWILSNKKEIKEELILDTNYEKDRVLACDNSHVNGSEIKSGQHQNSLRIFMVPVLSLKLSDHWCNRHSMWTRTLHWLLSRSCSWKWSNYWWHTMKYLATYNSDNGCLWHQEHTERLLVRLWTVLYASLQEPDEVKWFFSYVEISTLLLWYESTRQDW